MRHWRFSLILDVSTWSIGTSLVLMGDCERVTPLVHVPVGMAGIPRVVCPREPRVSATWSRRETTQVIATAHSLPRCSNCTRFTSLPSPTHNKHSNIKDMTNIMTRPTFNVVIAVHKALLNELDSYKSPNIIGSTQSLSGSQSIKHLHSMSYLSG